MSDAYKGHTIVSYTSLLIIVLLLTKTTQTCAQTTVRFAAVGDYGDNSNTQAVADMIDSWNPDVVITLGDNNYSNNSSVYAWDDEVGQYYGKFIHYPTGSTSLYAPGPVINQFFPALGNHDWDAGINGWYDYFELPGNERYYEFIQGPVHFFVIDSDSREPDEITETSTQGQWLQTQLASSTSSWKIVYFHHPPFSSSSSHGNTPELQWPFQSWDATAVLAGHDHLYERILKNGFPYFVNGAGGRSLYNFNSIPEPGSMVRYNSNYGAMLIEANTESITFQFYSISGGSGGILIDTYTLNDEPLPVNLSSFTSESGNGTVTLCWITQSEINNLGFILERALSSTGPFQEISSYEYNEELKGQGNSSVSTEYFYTDRNLENGNTYFYRLADVNIRGVKEYHPLINAIPQQLAKEFALYTNYPNPFNQGTMITFEIPDVTSEKSQVELVIYNNLGEVVRRLAKEPIVGGIHKIFWQGDNDQRVFVSSGVYFLKLKSDSFVQTQKMVLLR